MTRAASTAPTLVGALWAAGLGSLAVITLASPGATRMHAWPWSIAYAIALAAPVAIVIVRAFDPRRPLALPSRGWLLTALLAAVGIVLSALASPYRDQSLLWSAPLLGGIAFFFATFDAMHGTGEPAEIQREKILPLATAFLALIALVSLTLWIDGSLALGRGLAGGLDARNYYPLGHSNYTAGLALLLLPGAVALISRPRDFAGSWQLGSPPRERRDSSAVRLPSVPALPSRATSPSMRSMASRIARDAALAMRWRGGKRLAAAAVALLAFAQLFTSGSRGGIVGLAAIALGGFFAARWPGRKKLVLALVVGAAGATFIAANPRTRAMFAPADPAAAPNISNVQRTAMLTAATRMGVDRPLLGWGPGTTPLAFPRYRAGLDGGAENVLQLHSTPAQLWAELGIVGLTAALAFALLVVRGARTQPASAIALAGYAVFSLFDWQLDVPVFSFAVATLAALLAAPAPPSHSARAPRLVGGFALIAIVLFAFFARRDSAPELNVRALALAATRSPDTDRRASELLRASLALNPDQEIAHFNLGWLLLTADPAAAESHFRAAALLVPDKGGVYFGLGLARLNQGQRDAAARAFALECLNDPAFAMSPWWRDPAIAATRDAAGAAFADFLGRITPRVPPGTWAAAQLPVIGTLAPQLGRVPDGPERNYRRERIGYPVLMRNLDLRIPTDLYDVRELAPVPPSGTGRALRSSESEAGPVVPTAPLPPKGWLPSPLLLELLDASAPTIPKS